MPKLLTPEEWRRVMNWGRRTRSDNPARNGLPYLINPKPRTIPDLQFERRNKYVNSLGKEMR